MTRLRVIERTFLGLSAAAAANTLNTSVRYYPTIADSEIEVQKWFDDSIHFYHKEVGELQARKLPR